MFTADLVALQIKEYTQDRLTHMFDTISEGDSSRICEASISSDGRVVSHLLPAKHRRDDVANKFTLGYTVMGEAFDFDGITVVPAKAEDFEFGKMFCKLSTKLLAQRRIAVHPPTLGAQGLAGVLDGLQQLREGKVSGTKLVYRVDETP